MKKLIVSVPHTGTRFLKQRLKVVEHCHTTNSYDRLWDTIEKYDRRVIIPLRHPQDVVRSWITRDKHKQLGWQVQFGLAWTHLQYIYERCSAEVICVDKQEHPDIEDWTPIGNFDQKRNDGAEADHIGIYHIFQLPIVHENYEARPIEPIPHTCTELNNDVRSA